MKPQISVIIPVYNVEKYIDKCLDSVIAQDYLNIEIILLVKFGKDDSLNKCIEWQKKDERIIVICRKDLGLGDARNYGIKVANGEFVAFVDADDYVEKDYLSVMVEPLLKYSECKLSSCGFEKITNGGNIVQSWIPPIGGLQKLSYKEYLEILEYIQVWKALYRREWLISNRMWQFNGCCEDHSFHLILAAKVNEIFLIQRILYHYRVDRLESLTCSLRGKTDLGKAVAYAIEYLQKEQLYNQNKIYIKEYTVRLMVILLESCDYDETVIKVYADFLKEYFPEVVQRYLRRNVMNIDRNKLLVLWGAGKELNSFLDQTDVSCFSYIVDKNKKKHGMRIKGIPVISIDDFLKKANKCVVIITTIRYEFDVEEQLENYGIKNYLTKREYLKMCRKTNY